MMQQTTEKFYSKGFVFGFYANLISMSMRMLFKQNVY